MIPCTDMIGKKFGKLTVVSKGETIKHRVTYLCKCDCGNSTIVAGSCLKSGTIRSCGCLRGPRKKHGMSESRIYRVWKNIVQRTENPKSKSYYLYGARGIKLCDEWKNPAAFINWAMFSGYNSDAKKGECMLDRINNNKGYSPENCRWVTAKQQQRNRRDNRMLTLNGETLCITDWAKRLGCPLITLYNRIRYGWPLERVLTEPVKHHERKQR